ncbi:hypothetical protein [Rhodococcus sp. ZPP]|uniref:hypothetical protein n=1 Tax=Rhodococcus sp. ZPP TaxID=2749906 RepID=UPI001FCD61DF|nr:hypothetical protein [Rhodococcus sp. ZPP]
MLAYRLDVGRSEVHRHRLDPLRRALGQGVGEEGAERGGVLALGAPDDLAGLVVGDEGEVLVVPAPRNLVHPDVDQIREPVRGKFVGDHP